MFNPAWIGPIVRAPFPPSFSEYGGPSCDLRGVAEGVGAVTGGDGEHCSMFRSDVVVERNKLHGRATTRPAVSPLAGAEKAHHANAPSKLARFPLPLALAETMTVCDLGRAACLSSHCARPTSTALNVNM